MVHEVIHVEPLGGTRLRLTFRTGESAEVDIARLVPFTGIFAPLKDPGFFAQVAVNPDISTIVWPNGADLCPDVLYEAGAAASAPPRRGDEAA